MGSISDFLNNMDWWGLLTLLISAAAALLCITLHELSHGFVAWRLGDPTAKNAGRLTLNPIRHLDVVGLLMMLVAKVGWAKPVPVDMRYFKHPRQGMALTALAGPAANFLTALAAVGVSSAVFHLAPLGPAAVFVLCFLSNMALLGVGMGLFNLIPLSPLDGSKILFALLPDRIYYTILRYEKYVMGVVILLVPVGVERLCLALDIDRITADSVCQRLADAYRYERRGIRLVRLDNSYQLCSAPEFADCIRRAFESRRPARLSQPALEVLAIIAYYQPATRAYVDQIRGVDSSYTVSLLLERDLIEECGRLAVPGRPIQYRTTQTFLRSFGLSNLDELPELPNTTPEDGQLTLEMQAAVERLQAAQAAEGTEEVTEEELLQAAREMAQAEEEA